MAHHHHARPQDHHHFRDHHQPLLKEKLCWLCWWRAPPNPPPPVVIQSPSPTIDSNATIAEATPLPQKPKYKEIKTKEFRDGDKPVKYALTIPTTIRYNQETQVNLSGRIMTIIVTPDIAINEKVVVIAPSPVS